MENCRQTELGSKKERDDPPSIAAERILVEEMPGTLLCAQRIERQECVES